MRVMSVTTAHTRQRPQLPRPWRSTEDRGLRGPGLWHQRHSADTTDGFHTENSSYNVQFITEQPLRQLHIGNNLWSK